MDDKINLNGAVLINLNPVTITVTLPQHPGMPYGIDAGGIVAVDAAAGMHIVMAHLINVICQFNVQLGTAHEQMVMQMQAEQAARGALQRN